MARSVEFLMVIVIFAANRAQPGSLHMSHTNTTVPELRGAYSLSSSKCDKQSLILASFSVVFLYKRGVSLLVPEEAP